MKNVNSRAKIIVITAATVLLAGIATTQADNRENSDLFAMDQSLQANPGLAFAFRSDQLPHQQSGDDNQSAPAPAREESKVIIQSTDPSPEKEQTKVVTWLGLAVQESPEVLSSQLGLKSGEGLMVSFIAPDSPAAKAGFQKNDVLDELDSQMLVHPMQLRKLVRMHAEGDTVNLAYYRAGKKLTAAVKLGKTTLEEAADSEDESLSPALENLQIKLGGLNGKLRVMSDSLSRAGLDKAKVDVEIKRAMDKASRAVEEAVRRESTAGKALIVVDHDLEALARDGVDVDRDATVTVRNNHSSSRTMVQTDETGTIIIEAGAKKTHLTARGKDGKTLFDGYITTPAEQSKVPKEVWEKAKPMVEKLN
jgi:hypothetical protein